MSTHVVTSVLQKVGASVIGIVVNQSHSDCIYAIATRYAGKGILKFCNADEKSSARSGGIYHSPRKFSWHLKRETLPTAPLERNYLVALRRTQINKKIEGEKNCRLQKGKYSDSANPRIYEVHK